MATIEISNIIKVEKTDLNLDVIKTKFTHPNPRFFENQRLGFSNFATPAEIPLYAENESKVYFPRGLLKDIFFLTPNPQISDRTKLNPVNFNPSNIILKSYQTPALEAMLERNQGLLEAPPGSGKTVIGIELIVRRGQKSLLLVHTKDLCQQWIDRFKQFTDITPGVIDADKFDLRDITIGMVQSLRKPLNESFLNQWGHLILDECHHVPAFTFQQLINQFPAKYRYGLTATPNRRDGLDFILHAVLGPTVFQIKRKGLFDDGEIMKPIIRVVHTNFYNPRINDYRDLLEAIVMNAERNTLILRNIIREAEAGHFCLVLSNRIDHAQWMHQTISMLRSDLGSECLTSHISKNDRIQIIDLINEGQIKILCATQLADEGLDLRRLDRLFLTCPVRSINKVSQQIGRIVRTFPGKEDAYVYDFRDQLCSLAESQFQTRLKMVYQPNGYQIEEVIPNRDPAEDVALYDCSLGVL
jgi:superfamily II DNA or RNA helicase